MKRLNIALVAHDARKQELVKWCTFNYGVLRNHNLYATGTTGRLIEEVTNLSVHKYLAGPLGGDQQMGSQIENNDMDLVIFMRDPSQTAGVFDVHKLVRLCDNHNIPLATNLATAELLIKALERGDLEWREIYK